MVVILDLRMLLSQFFEELQGKNLEYESKTPNLSLEPFFKQVWICYFLIFLVVNKYTWSSMCQNNHFKACFYATIEEEAYGPQKRLEGPQSPRHEQEGGD